MRLTEAEFSWLAASKGQKNKARGPTETEIQAAIREHLQWHGWFVIRHHQSLGSHKGLSDLTALKAGRTVYIEVKTPKGVQSEDQKRFQAEIEAHGGLYVLARCVEDVGVLTGK